MVTALLIVVLAVLFLAYCATRAAWRNGVVDGYRAARFPNDPLYERVIKVLKENGVYLD